MMRPLRVSIAIATWMAQLAACDDGTRAQSAASRARDSSLAHDLAIASDSAAALRAAGRDTQAVTVSSGMLDSTSDSSASPAVAESLGARTASNASPSTASAEGYIGPSCASPAPEDQQRCLLGYLEKSDAELDRHYQALITRLKSEGGTKDKTGEPPSVERLRDVQRAWLVYRDDECRRRTRAREGPLWAPVRAQCLAEYSMLRARELEDALAKRKALEPRESKSRTKRPSARKSTRRRGTRGR